MALAGDRPNSSPDLAELLKRINDGPDVETAWKLIEKECYRPLCRRALLLTRGRAIQGKDYEDFAQETLIAIFVSVAARKLKDMPSTKAQAWELLYTILRNKIITALHKERVAAAHRHDAVHQQSEQVMEDTLLASLLDQCMRSLPEIDQTILHLRHGEGRTADEIGVILNLSAGNVRARLHRARKQLKNKINKRLPGTPPQPPGQDEELNCREITITSHRDKKLKKETSK